VFPPVIARLPPDAENRRELDRLNAFSDGVFAVAITLLVLNIETPSVDDDALWGALKDLGPDLSAYFIAFAVIGLFWYGHASMLSHLERTSGRLMIVNLALLSLIALLPFTTSLIGSYSDSEVALVVFAINLGAAATVDSLMDQVALRGDLYVPGEAPDPATTRIEGLLRPLVFLLSVPLALIDPLAAQLFWLTLFLIPEVAGWIVRRSEVEPSA
jgi:uncharacterized membrane protein